MDIIVCVKHVPETTEADLELAEGEKSIKTENLVFDINEWDNYALEEAVLTKEKMGGNVCVITVGSEDADSTLRHCLARGADEAIRLTDSSFERSDGYAIAKILHSVIKNRPFDLIFTGALASDYGYTMVGPILAEMLDINHATWVKNIEMDEDTIEVNRELEGGVEEKIQVELPALLTIQTGINEPRYVSFSGLRKARKKEIEVLSLEDIDLKENEVGESGSWMKVEKMFTPPVGRKAEFIGGTPEEVASKMIEIIKREGVV